MSGVFSQLDMRKKYPIILMAGSPKERDELMEYGNNDYKTLIEIEGKTILNYVLETIFAADIASYIILSGVPKDKVTLPKGFDPSLVEFYELEGGYVDKIYGAASRLLEIGKDKPEIFSTENKHVLYITGDIPTVTVEAIHDFVDKVGEPDGDGHLSVVEKHIMEAKFPGNKRSWVHLKGGRDFCIGDVNIISCNTIIEKRDLIKSLTEDRKVLAKALFKLSPFGFIRYIFRRITLEEIEIFLSKLFKMDTRVVVSEHAEIAFDVDKPHQLDLTAEYIKKLNISSH